MATGATAMPVTVPQNLLFAILGYPSCGRKAAIRPSEASIDDQRGHRRWVAPLAGRPSSPSTPRAQLAYPRRADPRPPLRREMHDAVDGALRSQPGLDSIAACGGGHE